MKDGDEIELEGEHPFSPEQLNAYSPAYSSKEILLGEMSVDITAKPEIDLVKTAAATS